MLEEPEKKINDISTDKNDSGTFKNNKSSLKNTILDRVVNSPAIFKSQQNNEPELTKEEKEKIANDLLEINHVKFLTKFGKYLDSNLLNYFIDNNNYELSYYIKRLNRYFDDKTREIDIKNRRYEALKELIEKGEYFSEVEMMRRNPLLYENLVGKYMTEQEKKTRDNLDTKNITFVNLLLEKIDRDGIKNLRKYQEEAEDDVCEENDSDNDSDSDENDMKKNNKWGEMSGDVDKHEKDKTRESVFVEIDDEEQHMLRQEFTTHMYQSFLDGKDQDFDYRYKNYSNNTFFIIQIRNYSINTANKLIIKMNFCLFF